MAKLNKSHNLKPAVFFFLVIMSLTMVSSSSARLLSDFLPQSHSATQPALNLALPTDHEVVTDVSPVNSSEIDSKNVLPCHMDSGKNSEVKIPARFAGKHGRSAILNMLPKGQVVYSGPSKGTNDVKN